MHQSYSLEKEAHELVLLIRKARELARLESNDYISVTIDIDGDLNLEMILKSHSEYIFNHTFAAIVTFGVVEEQLGKAIGFVGNYRVAIGINLVDKYLYMASGY